MSVSEICYMTATELVRRMSAGELSAVEALEAHQAQIARVNPAVNAIITHTPELALERARSADAARRAGRSLGPLHGLPIAHKDLQPTNGIRTTRGSVIYRNWIPDFDSLTIQRLREAGSVCLGKTNVPEFGVGSQTFNPVFGPTRNPYDLSKTCGGSSGGAAVALACGMIPIADGSDMGGSLRNPASFCNVVGMRPSAGRVPDLPTDNQWYNVAVDGPLARCVADVALVLSALAGPDHRAATALDAPGSLFARPLERDLTGGARGLVRERLRVAAGATRSSGVCPPTASLRDAGLHRRGRRTGHGRRRRGVHGLAACPHPGDGRTTRRAVWAVRP